MWLTGADTHSEDMSLFMYLITIPVGVTFLVFVIGGGLLLPLWEYLDARADRPRTRDVQLTVDEEEKAKAAA